MGIAPTQIPQRHCGGFILIPFDAFGCKTKFMAKKSLYVFLTSLLGVLLFLILHRLAIFFYLYLLAGGYVTTGMSYLQFLALDYLTLFFTLMFGAWYGIWLGMHWFEKVYVEKSHCGVIHHLTDKYFFRTPKNLESKISAIKKKIEDDLWQLEDLAKVSLKEVSAPQPIKRKVIRKIAPKKLKA